MNFTQLFTLKNKQAARTKSAAISKLKRLDSTTELKLGDYIENYFEIEKTGHSDQQTLHTHNDRLSKFNLLQRAIFHQMKRPSSPQI